MRILCDEERIPSREPELMETLKRAAKLCLKEEGIPDERIEISLSFVSMEEIHELNNMYRQVDRPTDVLSFPMIEDFNEIDWEEEEEEILLGDVVICLDKVRQQAKEYDIRKSGRSSTCSSTACFIFWDMIIWKMRTRLKCAGRKKSSWKPWI